MRVHATAEEDRAPGLRPSAPWRVADVQVHSGYRLHVRFMDGTEGEAVLAGLIERAGAGVFARLRDEGLFRKALARGYFNVDLRIVWESIRLDLPGLATRVKALLDGLSEDREVP